MASDHPAPPRIASPPALVALTVSFAIVCLSAKGPPPRVPTRIRGFSTAASAAEAALEQTFKASLSPKDAEADFDLLTAEPHHVGSPYDITLADEVSARFASFGMEVSRYEYS